MKILVKKLDTHGKRLLAYLTTDTNQNMKAKLTNPEDLDKVINELSRGVKIDDVIMLD